MHDCLKIAKCHKLIIILFMRYCTYQQMTPVLVTKAMSPLRLGYY